VPYTVGSNDTLVTLAYRYRISVNELMQGNCLISQTLYTGQVIRVPRVVVPPTPRPPCTLQPPVGWVQYNVQPGDTLYSLAVRTRTTVYAIVQVNCLGGYTIYAGQQLWLPLLPPTPPPPTSTMPPPATHTPTATATLAGDTPTPSPTVGVDTPTPTATTGAPGDTPTPTGTNVPPTNTPTQPRPTDTPVLPSPTPTTMPPTDTPPPPPPTPTLPPPSPTPPPTNTPVVFEPPPTETGG
jgi:LysM repeat protein